MIRHDGTRNPKNILTVKMESEKVKSCCASICTVISAVAVPVLIYIALLCGAGSRLIEIPQNRKTSAAVGCWIAAALYVTPLR